MTADVTASKRCLVFFIVSFYIDKTSIKSNEKNNYIAGTYEIKVHYTYENNNAEIIGLAHLYPACRLRQVNGGRVLGKRIGCDCVGFEINRRINIRRPQTRTIPLTVLL